MNKIEEVIYLAEERANRDFLKAIRLVNLIHKERYGSFENMLVQKYGTRANRPRRGKKEIEKLCHLQTVSQGS